MRQPNSGALPPKVAFEAQNALQGIGRSLEAGDTQGALLHSTKLVRLVPGDPQVQLTHGSVLVQSKRPLEAEKAFKEALRLAPNHPDALYELGKLKAQSGALTEAERWIRLSREAGYDSPNSRVLLAKV